MFIFTEICCHRLLLMEGLLMLTVLYTSQSISRASRENVASSTRSSRCHGWLQLWCHGAGFASLTVTVDGVPRSPPSTGFSVGLLQPSPGSGTGSKGNVASSDCVALRLLMPVTLWLVFHLRPQWGGLAVSLQNYENIYIYLQVHKYINMAIIEK